MRSRRWATPGCCRSAVPNTASASAPRSGRQTSSTWRTASIAPSGSRRAKRSPAESESASASPTSRVIGMGHSVPSPSRMPEQTAAWWREVMNPVSGEKPPSSSSSRSQSWRGVRSWDGQSRDAEERSATRSGAANRSTRVPPWGAMRWADNDANPPPGRCVDPGDPGRAAGPAGLGGGTPTKDETYHERPPDAAGRSWAAARGRGARRIRGTTAPPRTVTGTTLPRAARRNDRQAARS